MLGHYFAIAIRNFGRHRLHTVLTIAVLSLGLICFIVAGLLVLHLRSFDRQFPNADRIYVVYQSSKWPSNGYAAALGPSTAPPVAAQLKADVPELAGVARFVMSGSMVSINEGDPAFRRVAYVDPDWLRIFDLDVIAGDANGALGRPRTAIITQETAEKMFGTASAVGRVLSMIDIGIRTEVTIAAVVANVPAPSHLVNGQFAVGFEILCSWDVFEATYPGVNLTSWIYPSIRTYALLPDDGSLSANGFNSRLRAFAPRTFPEDGAAVQFEARPVSQFAQDELLARLEGFGGGGSLPMRLSSIVLWLGALILGIACLNFINLTTARSSARAREVGVRKSLGATARGVIYQDFLQTALTVLIATSIAFAVIWLFGQTLENRWRVVLGIPWSTPSFWLLFGALLAAVTVVAGAYPAAVLARVNPVTALRLGTMKSGPKLLRTLLVGVQFGSAAFLVLAVTVVYLQTNRLREAALGRFGDPYVVLNPNLRRTVNLDFEVLAAELARGPGIKGVAGISVSPWQGGNYQQPLDRSVGEVNSAILVESRYVTHDYFAVMETPLLAGRWFSKEHADDPVPVSPEQSAARSSPPRIVIDRRGASEFGWSRPEAAVGEIVYSGKSARQPLEIIGVVENSSLSLRNRGSGGFVYWLAPQFSFATLIRVSPTEVAGALEHIDAVWKNVAPSSRIFRQFLDESFEAAYFWFKAANRVVVGLAIFATVIASIGLFGMASYMTSLSTREIGVRKCQGATRRQILRLLLWDFSKPVLLANVVIWPVAYIAARAYLDLFIERMTLTPLPFLATLAATVSIALLAISVQVLRAASLNPTLAMHHE